MSKEIRIDAPGAGEWIMEQVGGVFRPEYDHSIASYRDGKLLGGFVLAAYMGNSIAVHDAACDPRWCSRELMWMLCHYVFRQLNCKKLIAPVPSDNTHALELNFRAGFRLEAIIKDALAPGLHLLLLTMEATSCRWLDILPQQYFPGGIARKVSTP